MYIVLVCFCFLLSLFGNLLLYHGSSSNFKLQLHSYDYLQRTLISLKKIKFIPKKSSGSKSTCRDTILITLSPISEKKNYISPSPNEIEDLISILISIFFSCPSPDSVHYVPFLNIVHLCSLQYLFSMHRKHSSLFPPKITKQHKQKENSSLDTSYHSVKLLRNGQCSVFTYLNLTHFWASTLQLYPKTH